MTLQICDIAPHLEVETTECPVRFYNCIDYRGLRSDQRQRVTQHVIHHPHAARAQASHDLGDVGLRTLQAAAGGGAAIIRTLAKAVLAAAGKWWRAYNIRRAHIAAARELHALDDRTLRDIGVSRSEIEWVVVHGRGAPRFNWASQSCSPNEHTWEFWCKVPFLTPKKRSVTCKRDAKNPTPMAGLGLQTSQGP